MGALYRGLDPVIGRQVAVKVIRTDLLDTHQQEEYRTRFDQEVRAAGRCIHPGIVTIFDYGEWRGNPFIVMEYVEGRPLQQVLAKGSLAVEQSVQLVEKLLDALGHAHAQGVVHRDIKPGNVILTGEDHVKITDFGVALIDTSSMTVAGALLGTPQYMAPEQARGERVDHRADLFSVGVILFRMLTGRSPYGDDGLAAVLTRVAADDPVDVAAVDVISPMLACVVALALQKDASARFQSAPEFSHALRAALSPELNSSGKAAEALKAKTAQRGARIPAASRQAIKRAFLGRVRPLLLSAIGPIADHVITQIDRSCLAEQDVTAALALHFGGRQEEPSFRALVAAEKRWDQPCASSPATYGTRDRDAGPLALSPQFAKLVQDLLASFIGPISGIVMRQSLFVVRGSQELSDRLAMHIRAADERSLFQAHLRRLMIEHGLTTQVATEARYQDNIDR